MANNEHHILHDRLEWSLRDDANKIRELPPLKPRMDIEVHRALHKSCPSVPLLGRHALNLVRRDFYPSRDTFASLDDLFFAIENAGRHPKAHSVERNLASLVIGAIELQIPFIREGIILPRDI